MNNNVPVNPRVDSDLKRQMQMAQQRGTGTVDTYKGIVPVGVKSGVQDFVTKNPVVSGLGTIVKTAFSAAGVSSGAGLVKGVLSGAKTLLKNPGSVVNIVKSLPDLGKSALKLRSGIKNFASQFDDGGRIKKYLNINSKYI